MINSGQCSDPGPWAEGCDRELCCAPVGGDHAETCVPDPELCVECGIFPRLTTTVGGARHLCQQCLDRARRAATR